jgi:transposase
MQNSAENHKLQIWHLELKSHEMITIGIDVHKLSWTIAIFSSQRRRVIKVWNMPADMKALLNILEPLREHIDRIGYEAGPTGFGLARFMREFDFNVCVVAPSEMDRPSGKKAKSDKLDAKKLAKALDYADVPTVYIPTEEEEDAREAFRNREQLRKKITRCKCQIKSLLLKWGVPEPEGLQHWSKASVEALYTIPLPPNAMFELETYLSELKHLEALIQKAEAQMKAVAEEYHAEDFANTQSVQGVGFITASAFLLELPQLRELPHANAVAKITGLCPVRQGSGQRDQGCGRDPGGKKRVRHLLIEASWRWIKLDSWARAHFERVCAGKQDRRKIAIVAVARRLAIILWRIVVEGRPYEKRDAQHLSV